MTNSTFILFLHFFATLLALERKTPHETPSTCCVGEEARCVNIVDGIVVVVAASFVGREEEEEKVEEEEEEVSVIEPLMKKQRGLRERERKREERKKRLAAREERERMMWGKDPLTGCDKSYLLCQIC